MCPCSHKETVSANVLLPAGSKIRHLVCFAITIAFAGGGCSSTVNAPQAPLQSVNVGGPNTTEGERIDPDAEQVVGDETLIAWRLAIAHNKRGDTPESSWKATRAKDEEQSMAKLRDLAKRYPTSSTVQLMMGQVEEQFGHHKEAAEFFGQSVDMNRHNSMALFKEAENLRTAGDAVQAAETYRRLLKQQPDFLSGRLGLGICLLKVDHKSQEGKTLVAGVLANAKKMAAEPADKKEASLLLKEILEADPGNLEAKQALSQTDESAGR
jgi:tetratricopeptide (TPR) repeat protein